MTHRLATLFVLCLALLARPPRADAAGKRVMADDAPSWKSEPLMGCDMLGDKVLQGPSFQAGMDRGGLSFNPDGSVFIVTEKNILFRTQDGVVRLLAGRPGLSGYQDGHAGLARFNKINGVARDGKGGLYINDRGNLCIRRLFQKDDGQWRVETVAGIAGQAGRKDGPAREALFADPCNLAINSKGELFTMDKDFLRTISNGQVTTLNPSGGKGFQDGPLESAKFNLIMGGGAACDGDDNLFIADRWNSRFRKVDFATGQVSTYAGSGKRAHHEDGPFQECAVEPGSLTWNPHRKSFYVVMVDSSDLARLEDGWLKTVIKNCRMSGLDADGNIYAWDKKATYRFYKWTRQPNTEPAPTAPDAEKQP